MLNPHPKHYSLSIIGAGIPIPLDSVNRTNTGIRLILEFHNFSTVYFFR
jgi:hypothetical protein